MARWSSLGWHRLGGRNVQDNDRVQAMAGAYRRIINEEDRLLTAGVNAMLWRFGERKTRANSRSVTAGTTARGLRPFAVPAGDLGMAHGALLVLRARRGFSLVVRDESSALLSDRCGLAGPSRHPRVGDRRRAFPRRRQWR